MCHDRSVKPKENHTLLYMQQPFVSVIIPNYCHARYLDERIQSVLNQTYQNFELIILDDCSPDNGASREVIERYRSDSHVAHIVYNEQNSGNTFRQWHKGFQLAKGELIWIAESDDACELTLLETLVKGFEDHQNLVLAFCQSLYVDEDGKPLCETAELENQEPIHYDGKEFIRRRMLYTNTVANASSAVFRKDVALRVDGQYQEYKAAGDRLFWIELAECGDVYEVPTPLNHFRRHGGSVSPGYYGDGTTMEEDCRINRYMERQGYLLLKEKLLARCCYMNVTRDADFPKAKKKEIMRELTYHGLLPHCVLKNTIIVHAKLKSLLGKKK